MFGFVLNCCSIESLTVCLPVDHGEALVLHVAITMNILSGQLASKAFKTRLCVISNVFSQLFMLINADKTIWIGDEIVAMKQETCFSNGVTLALKLTISHSLKAGKTSIKNFSVLNQSSHSSLMSLYSPIRIEMVWSIFA